MTQNINKETGEFIVETNPQKFKVKRSFDDFELVLKYLNEQFNYYVIPQISNKKYGEKYTEEKANKRTRALNKFLDGIIEFSNGEIIKENKEILAKYPNSILAACINNKISLPKRKNSIFLDRNYSDFKLVLYFLKKSKLPKWKMNYKKKNLLLKNIKIKSKI